MDSDIGEWHDYAPDELRAYQTKQQYGLYSSQKSEAPAANFGTGFRTGRGAGVGGYGGAASYAGAGGGHDHRAVPVSLPGRGKGKGKGKGKATPKIDGYDEKQKAFERSEVSTLSRIVLNC
jgi:hypothetical protein